MYLSLHISRKEVSKMKLAKLAIALVCVLGLLLLGTSALSLPDTGKPLSGIDSQEYKPGEVLVRFKEGTDPKLKEDIKDSAGEKATLKQVAPTTGNDIQLIKLEPDVTVEQAVAELQARPEVLYAEPNYTRELLYNPSDPGFPNQWGLHNTGQTIEGQTGTPDADIDAPEAWNIEKGNTSPVEVAVIDTGIDLSHPDLASKLWQNPGEVPGNSVDDDGNGYVDDYNGYNWTGISQYRYSHYEYLGYASYRKKFAQSFKARASAGHTQKLSHVGIALAKTGNPSATIKVIVRSSLGGSNLASFTIDPSEVSKSEVREIYKPLSSTLSLTPGATYYLVIRTSSVDSSNYYRLYTYGGNSILDLYLEGKEYRWDGSAWVSMDHDDLYFKTNPYYYPYDYYGHGTHCSGIVGAKEGGGNVVGVSFGANTRIMALKIGDSSGVLYEADILEAIYYAADNGADVLSMSFGGPYSSAEQDAVNYAHGKGAVLFASAGNGYGPVIYYPAGCDNVIGVGATNNRDQRASFSSYNSSVDVSAPGVDVYSTMPTYPVYVNNPYYGYEQDYDYMSGTSMACPMAAGLAALIRSQTPYLDPNQVEELIEGHADDKGTPGRDDEYGHGRINAYSSLAVPNIASIQPSILDRGGQTNISGCDFGATRGSSYVSFGAVQATTYTSWSDTAIGVKRPAGAKGEYLVTVTTPAGTSNGVTCYFVNPPSGCGAGGGMAVAMLGLTLGLLSVAGSQRIRKRLLTRLQQVR
ncbi:MAG: S8 family serine peptidase [Actinobacteria bacterium]|nr:S8 family serine peptidase [Actinomycetota bacterium]